MREPAVTVFLTLVLQLSASSQPASEAPRLSAACRASQPLPIPIPMPAPHPKPSGSLQGLGLTGSLTAAILLLHGHALYDTL